MPEPTNIILYIQVGLLSFFIVLFHIIDNFFLILAVWILHCCNSIAMYHNPHVDASRKFPGLIGYHWVIFFQLVWIWRVIASCSLRENGVRRMVSLLLTGPAKPTVTSPSLLELSCSSSRPLRSTGSVCFCTRARIAASSVHLLTWSPACSCAGNSPPWPWPGLSWCSYTCC